MEVKYKPTFIKDFNKIKSKKDQKDIYKICFEDIRKMGNILDIKNLKKIKGYEHYSGLGKAIIESVFVTKMIESYS